MAPINKRGIATGELVGIILVVAIATVVMFFAYSSMNSMREGIGMDACRLSILKAAEEKKLNLPSKGSVFSPLNCRRSDLGFLELDVDDIVINGELNQKAASKKVADTMADCWKMVGEGRLDPFSNWEDEGSYCLICKRIKFSEDLKEYLKKENKGIVSPMPYMLETKTQLGGKRQTYFEYIWKTKNPFSEQEIKEMEKYGIEDGSAILIKMFKTEQKGGWGDMTLAIGGTALLAGGAILTFTGVGAVVGIPLMYTAGAALIGGGMVGYTMIDPAGINAFSECPECNGIGSIRLIPPSFSLRSEVDITYKGVMVEGEPQDINEEGAYCHHLVN